MKSKVSSKIGCAIAVAFFFLIIILSSLYYRFVDTQQVEIKNGISWAAAVEKCKSKYEAYRPSGQIKAPNCRKRTEDREYFYFTWKKPLAIILRKSDGTITKIAAKCQVSKESGKIVSMTLGKSVLVKKSGKKK